MDRYQTYLNAFIHFGEPNQMFVCIEELSECEVEVASFLNGKGNLDNLAEEIADAQIGLEQIQMILGIDELVAESRSKLIITGGTDLARTIRFLSETQKEICKFLRGFGNASKISWKIAFTLAYLHLIQRDFGIEDQVQKWMERKIERLDARLNN